MPSKILGLWVISEFVMEKLFYKKYCAYGTFYTTLANFPAESERKKVRQT
jgi:hypothetical protein